MKKPDDRLILLGVGQVARAIASRAHGEFALFGTTRSAEHAAGIQTIGVKPIVLESFSALAVSELKPLIKDAFVVVSFPPDEESDRLASQLSADAAGVVYISSTAVYGTKSGEVSEQTEVDRTSRHAIARLNAEEKWAKVNSTILRAPGIYGSGNGLHQRLLSGHYRIPGDGNNYVSRIHVTDLADMALAALKKQMKDRVYVVGDELPTTHKEIVEWLIAQLNLPMPESIPLEQCHYTQQGNRQVNSLKARQDLKPKLDYPTYKEGYAEMLRRN